MRSKSHLVTSPPELNRSFPTGHNLVFWYHKMSVNSQIVKSTAIKALCCTKQQGESQRESHTATQVVTSQEVTLTSCHGKSTSVSVVNLRVPNFSKEYRTNKRQKYLVRLMLHPSCFLTCPVYWWRQYKVHCNVSFDDLQLMSDSVGYKN